MRLLLILAVAICLALASGCGDQTRDTARKQRAAARRLLEEQRREQQAEMERLDELVRDNPDVEEDEEGNWVDLGTTTKSVKQSIVFLKCVKALGEALERIEALEAKVG